MSSEKFEEKVEVTLENTLMRSKPIFILASRSPRRCQLLEEAGYTFEIFPASEDAEDAPRPGESSEDYVKRLAFQKAKDVVRRVSCKSSKIVIACDTVVIADEKILGKPADRCDARNMLRLLRGTIHSVISGLCLWETSSNQMFLELEKTTLSMDVLSDELLEQYLETGKWSGKAGAFGYQDGYDWLHIVHGSESNVVGLPMELLEKMIAKLLLLQ